jgi:hypothetical protein
MHIFQMPIILAVTGIFAWALSRVILDVEVQHVRNNKWVCFHCGFATGDEAEAAAHFGDRDDAEEFKPLCKWWRRMTKLERVGEFQTLIKELNQAQEQSYADRREAEKWEYIAGSQESDINSRFPGCSSLQDIWNKFDLLKGELLVAQEQIASDDFWKQIFGEQPGDKLNSMREQVAGLSLPHSDCSKGLCSCDRRKAHEPALHA